LDRETPAPSTVSTEPEVSHRDGSWPV
jgi:hypothetical protein